MKNLTWTLALPLGFLCCVAGCKKEVPKLGPAPPPGQTYGYAIYDDPKEKTYPVAVHHLLYNGDTLQWQTGKEDTYYKIDFDDADVCTSGYIDQAHKELRVCPDKLTTCTLVKLPKTGEGYVVTKVHDGTHLKCEDLPDIPQLRKIKHLADTTDHCNGCLLDDGDD